MAFEGRHTDNLRGLGHPIGHREGGEPWFNVSLEDGHRPGQPKIELSHKPR